MARKKGSKSAAPADETKAQKFVRLGDKRLPKAVRGIEILGNLAGSGYEYTEAQVAFIRSTLTKAVNDTLDKFNPKAAKGKSAVASLANAAE